MRFRKFIFMGFPHTDSRGNFRTTYDPQSSFFQIGMWGVPSPDEHHDWAILKKAGFNTVWPWLYTKDPSALLEAGKKK